MSMGFDYADPKQVLRKTAPQPHAVASRSSGLEDGVIVQAPAGAPAPLDVTNPFRDQVSSQVESNAAMIFMSDIRGVAEQNFRWQASTNDEDDRRHAALRVAVSDARIASAAAAAPEMAPIGSTAHRKQSVRILKAQEKWVTSQEEQGAITEQADTGDSAVPWKETKRSLAPWFRGVGYTRTNAESELVGRAVGTYMIRVSESRCGYTLTCLQETCVRHYPIDETDGCSFKLRGSNEKEFDSLPNLIAFYEQEPLSGKHPTEKLSGPIGKVPADGVNDGAVEYAEVDFSGLTGNITGALGNDSFKVVYSETVSIMEQRFSARPNADLPKPVHMNVAAEGPNPLAEPAATPAAGGTNPFGEPAPTSAVRGINSFGRTTSC